MRIYIYILKKTWSYIKTDIKKIRKTQIAHERMMTNIRLTGWKQKRMDRRTQMKLDDAVERMARIMWNWPRSWKI